MRGARRLGGAVVTIALLVAALWTCADGERSGDAETVGTSASAPPNSAPSAAPAASPPAEAEVSPGRPRRADRAGAHAVPVADADDVSSPVEQGPAVIAGRVVVGGEADALALAGVKVRLLVPDGPDSGAAAWLGPRLTDVQGAAAEAVTGADGRFEFAAPGDRPWTVLLLPPEHRAESFPGDGPADLGDLFVAARRPVTLRAEDEDGSPLADAEARVFGEGARPLHAVGADPAGAIQLDASRPVLVTAPGREFAFLQNPRDEEHVRLGPAAPLAGRVEDDRGTPLARVNVILDAGARLLAVTDAEGRFRFEAAGVRCGSEGQNLWVLLPGNRRELFQAMPGDEDVRIVVPRTSVIEGVVVFEDGRPAAGASVERTTADAEGRFRLARSPSVEGPARIEAVLRSRPSGAFVVRTHEGSAEVDVAPGATVGDVRIVLRETPYSFFRVEVRREDGRPALASVWAQAPWFEAGTCDARTPFAVGVPPGTTLRLVVNGTDATVARTETDVVTSADPKAAATVVVLGGPRACEVRVVDAAGNPFPAGDVTMRVEAVQGVVVAADGRVVAAPGTWVRVVAEARGLRWEHAVTIPAPPQESVEIRFPPTGTVRGRFVRADGGPAAGVGVSVLPGVAGFAPAGCGPCGADGVFVVSSVPAGRAVLSAWRDDEGAPEAAARQIVVPADGDLDLGDVVVWDDVRLEGRVLGADGAGVGGASVTVTWNAGRGSASVASGPGGRFSLRVPGARDAVAVASRREGTACAEPVDLCSSRTATLRLRPTGTVEVRVPRAWEATGWDLTLEPPSGPCAWEPDREDDGLVSHLLRVPAGRWVVVARAGEAVQRREVVVAAGGAAVVEMGP